MRLSILPNTMMHLSCMWRINTVPTMDVWQSLNLKACRETISSLQQRLQAPVNLPLIHMICPAKMRNTKCQTMWLKGHSDKAITQHIYWLPPGSIWIHPLDHQSTVGKSIQISMITTLSQWRLGVHFGYWILPTGGENKRQHTQSTPSCISWHKTYSRSYHMVLELTHVFPLGKTLSARGTQKPLARPFRTRLL